MARRDENAAYPGFIAESPEPTETPHTVLRSEDEVTTIEARVNRRKVSEDDAEVRSSGSEDDKNVKVHADVIKALVSELRRSLRAELAPALRAELPGALSFLEMEKGRDFCTENEESAASYEFRY